MSASKLSAVILGGTNSLREVVEEVLGVPEVVGALFWHGAGPSPVGVCGFPLLAGTDRWAWADGKNDWGDPAAGGVPGCRCPHVPARRPADRREGPEAVAPVSRAVATATAAPGR